MEGGIHIQGENWAIADDKIKHEIILSREGLGRKKARIASIVFGIMALLVLGLFLFQKLVPLSEEFYQELPPMELPMLVILILAFGFLWLMIWASACGIPMLVRYLRVKDGIVSYQYCIKQKEFVSDQGVLLVLGILADGTELVGKSEASDNHRNSLGMRSGNQMIAYRKGSKAQVYFSYVGK